MKNKNEDWIIAKQLEKEAEILLVNPNLSYKYIQTFWEKVKKAYKD